MNKKNKVINVFLSTVLTVIVAIIAYYGIQFLGEKLIALVFGKNTEYKFYTGNKQGYEALTNMIKNSVFIWMPNLPFKNDISYFFAKYCYTVGYPIIVPIILLIVFKGILLGGGGLSGTMNTIQKSASHIDPANDDRNYY